MNLCYFILRGCIRHYYIDEDGREITLEFYTEDDVVIMFDSYKNAAPIDSYFSCVAETIAIVGDLDSEEMMYQMMPEVGDLTRSMMESSFAEHQKERNLRMTTKPETRYVQLLEARPELFERVPQHQIASYLGVTPETLSRIKKRLN